VCCATGRQVRRSSSTSTQSAAPFRRRGLVWTQRAEDMWGPCISCAQDSWLLLSPCHTLQQQCRICPDAVTPQQLRMMRHVVRLSQLRPVAASLCCLGRSAVYLQALDSSWYPCVLTLPSACACACASICAHVCSGTGKTLLARAVANRTDACFIRVIGSELVQKYVGEVRDHSAKQYSICTAC
jgi:hypothetical protein